MKLSLDESTQYIVKLVNLYPSLTIVIDAFEECDPKTSYRLLAALEKIIKLSSKPVKIFISSRSQDNIPATLRDWPEIYITKEDNAEDIKKFIEHEVQQSTKTRRMLGGRRISSELKQHLVSALADGAQGM
jgi:ankyrin repeat domain-containing protein 50